MHWICIISVLNIFDYSKIARVQLEEEMVATERWRAQILLEQVESCWRIVLIELN